MYAVVIFTSESSNGEKTVNEVPISWLSEDQKFCWWPPANSNLYIARNKIPNEQSWKLYPVVVECICGMFIFLFSTRYMNNIYLRKFLILQKNKCFIHNFSEIW